MKKDKGIILADTKTANVLSVLDEKIQSLKAITECNYKTSGVMTGFGVNVKEETKIENLLRMGSSISLRAKAYDEFANSIGRTTYPVFSDNGTVDDWNHDIKLRLAVIEYKETLDKLTSYKEKMSKFLSEAEQKEMLMGEMAGFLSSLK